MGSSCSTNQRDEDEWCRPRITQSIKRKSKRKKKKKTTDHERRKHLIKVLSTEVQTSELLSRIPGRICNNGSTSSACAFTQQGKKGTNQDAMVVWEHYASRKDTLLCGVFDGHGPYGHLVARRVRDTLPSKLMAIWKARMRGEIDVEDEDEEEDEDEDEEEEEEYVGYDGDIQNMRQQHANVRNTHHNLWDQHEQEEPRVAMKMWRECIAKTFCRMDRDLRIQPTIDCFCSGSTAVVLLQQGKELIMGNVGDSRAVLATFFCPDSSNVKAIRQDSAGTTSLRAVQLTLDLKPSLPREAERIRRCKGRVFALDDEPEVPRVWLPYDDAPGLAMARAFGDFCLKDYGLISVPDITYRTLTPDDQFVILATDGIWDVMSNRQAVEVVASAPSRVTAARFLVETAVRAWRLKYPTSKVDDCAVICLFFHHDTSPIAQDRTSTTSSYYYTQEGEEDEDEEEEDTVTTACAPAAPAPTPEPASPAAHVTQSSAEGAQLQSNESEEISWGRTNTIRTPRHPNYVEDRVHRTPYDSYAEFDAITSPAFEIEEILPPSPTSKKQEAATSPARRSLAEYMLSSNPNDDEDDEWSALDGVVRVNSILNLPRFKVGDTPSLRKP